MENALHWLHKEIEKYNRMWFMNCSASTLMLWSSVNTEINVFFHQHSFTGNLLYLDIWFTSYIIPVFTTGSTTSQPYPFIVLTTHMTFLKDVREDFPCHCICQHLEYITVNLPRSLILTSMVSQYWHLLVKIVYYIVAHTSGAPAVCSWLYKQHWFL